MPFQLVDTKSSNGLNLLHFLERTISQHFPDILEFRKELEKPAEAYRGTSCSKLIPHLLTNMNSEL